MILFQAVYWNLSIGCVYLQMMIRKGVHFIVILFVFFFLLSCKFFICRRPDLFSCQSMQFKAHLIASFNRSACTQFLYVHVQCDYASAVQISMERSFGWSIVFFPFRFVFFKCCILLNKLNFICFSLLFICTESTKAI